MCFLSYFCPWFLGIPLNEQPTLTERQKHMTVIPTTLNMEQLEDFICHLYPRIPSLARIGMNFARTTKQKQLVRIDATTVEQLRQEVKRSNLYIIPKRDLLSIQVITL